MPSTASVLHGCYYPGTSWMQSAPHEEDIQKDSDTVRKMEKQRNQDEQNWKAQMDAVHDVLDTKVNEKPFEDLKHCTASLTKGVVKFAQVVGVFPGPRFDDAEGADATEADIELLGWEDCAENMSFRVDKAWRQRCSQRSRRPHQEHDGCGTSSHLTHTL